MNQIQGQTQFDRDFLLAVFPLTTTCANSRPPRGNIDNCEPTRLSRAYARACAINKFLRNAPTGYYCFYIHADRAVASCTPLEYKTVHTVIEAPLFTKLWPDYWSEDERGECAAFLARFPSAGDLIPGSGGCRKIRWGRAGVGKRGGVRVIYTTHLIGSVLVLLVIYSKSARENIPAHVLRQIAREMGHATS